MDVTEEQISNMVHRFYGSARADESLGPIFNEAVKDWDAHMATVADYWSGVLLNTDRYNGRPFPAHVGLPIKPEHFERWLSLFTRAADATLPPEAAQKAKARGALMIDSFRAGLFPFHRAGRPAEHPLAASSPNVPKDD